MKISLRCQVKGVRIIFFSTIETSNRFSSAWKNQRRKFDFFFFSLKKKNENLQLVAKKRLEQNNFLLFVSMCRTMNSTSLMKLKTLFRSKILRLQTFTENETRETQKTMTDTKENENFSILLE